MSLVNWIGLWVFVISGGVLIVWAMRGEGPQ